MGQIFLWLLLCHPTPPPPSAVDCTSVLITGPALSAPCLLGWPRWRVSACFSPWPGSLLTHCLYPTALQRTTFDLFGLPPLTFSLYPLLIHRAKINPFVFPVPALITFPHFSLSLFRVAMNSLAEEVFPTHRGEAFTV